MLSVVIFFNSVEGKNVGWFFKLRTNNFVQDIELHVTILRIFATYLRYQYGTLFWDLTWCQHLQISFFKTIFVQHWNLEHNSTVYFPDFNIWRILFEKKIDLIDRFCHHIIIEWSCLCTTLNYFVLECLWVFPMKVTLCCWDIIIFFYHSE